MEQRSQRVTMEGGNNASEPRERHRVWGCGVSKEAKRGREREERGWSRVNRLRGINAKTKGELGAKQLKTFRSIAFTSPRRRNRHRRHISVSHLYFGSLPLTNPFVLYIFLLCAYACDYCNFRYVSLRSYYYGSVPKRSCALWERCRY